MRRDFCGEICGRAESPILPTWEGTESHRFSSDLVRKASWGSWERLPSASVTNHDKIRAFKQQQSLIFSSFTLWARRTQGNLSLLHVLSVPEQFTHLAGKLTLADSWGVSWDCLHGHLGFPPVWSWVPTGREGKLPFPLEDRHRQAQIQGSGAIDSLLDSQVGLHIQKAQDNGGHLWGQRPHHRTSGFEGVPGTWGLIHFSGV